MAAIRHFSPTAPRRAVSRLIRVPFIALAAVALVGVGPTLATEGDPHKVTICHATHSETNPYVEITVDHAAVDGEKNNDHSHHTGPIWYPGAKADGVDWGDIIPPVEGVNPGQNWTEEGEDLWENDCQIPDEPPEQLGQIVIEKETDPSNETESFAFDINETPFALHDGESLDDIFPAGAYEVSEMLTAVQVTAGWSLESITCSDETAVLGEDDNVALSLEAGESIVCTFLNVQATAAAAAPSVSAGTCAAPGALTLSPVTGVVYAVTPTYTAGASGTFTVNASAAPGFTLVGPTSFVVTVDTRLVCNDGVLGGNPTPTPAVPNTATVAPRQVPAIALSVVLLASLGSLLVVRLSRRSWRSDE